MTPKLCIESVPIESLVPDPRNPRKHSKAQIRQIARSMTAFGNVVPILIARGSRIVAGHGRLEAGKQLGLTELPVIRLEHLTDAQARALAIADNRLTDNSNWDARLLGEIFGDLSAQDLTFDLEATGFSTAEIDLLIEGLPGADGDSDAADAIPEPSSQVPVSKAGDLWALGEHKVLCGNALEQTSYLQLLGRDKAHVVFTDPPYNVPIDGHASGLGTVQHREFAMASGEMSSEQFAAFLTTTCAQLARYTVDGAIHYACIDWRHVDALLAAGKRSQATANGMKCFDYFEPIGELQRGPLQTNVSQA